VSAHDQYQQAREQYQQAREMMDRGRHAEAVPLLQESIAAVPHFKSLELLGECYVKLERLDEAVVPLAAATTLNNGVRAPALLAEVFLRLGDHHDAQALAGVALARSATNRMALAVRRALEEQPHDE